MTTNPIFVGVDVAKETLDVGLRPSGEGWSVPNEEAGVTARVGRLRSLRPALVVCEATGGFERAVIEFSISPLASATYTPYGYIMQRDCHETKPLLGRINKISGQVQGVGRMIEENRECPEIL